MKKMMTLAVMMVMTISANAMSYTAAKNEALFLSDKMAYELNLTDAQYEAVYEINLDYLMSVDSRADVFGIWWDRRNADLRFVLNSWQYDKYVALSHFYRPVAWKAGGWTFAVYSHYDRGHFYKARPTVFVTYRGGNNRKADRFYADRHVAKPAPKTPVAKHAPAPAAKPNNRSTSGRLLPTGRKNATWRNTGNARPNVTSRANGQSNANRQIAQKTTVSTDRPSNGSRNSHFGGRR